LPSGLGSRHLNSQTSSPLLRSALIMLPCCIERPFCASQALHLEKLGSPYGTIQAQIVGHPGHRDPAKLTREMISYRFAAAMPQQLRPMILFSEALTRFRNRACESLHFERLNEQIGQLIQNQLFDRSVREFNRLKEIRILQKRVWRSVDVLRSLKETGKMALFLLVTRDGLTVGQLELSINPNYTDKGVPPVC
jgi:hypothetical protein